MRLSAPVSEDSHRRVIVDRAGQASLLPEQVDEAIQHFSFNFNVAGAAYGLLALGGKYTNPHHVTQLAPPGGLRPDEAGTGGSAVSLAGLLPLHRSAREARPGEEVA